MSDFIDPYEMRDKRLFAESTSEGFRGERYMRDSLGGSLCVVINSSLSPYGCPLLRLT